MDFIQTWYDRCYCTQHFDTSLIDFDLDSSSQFEWPMYSLKVIGRGKLEVVQSLCCKVA